MLITLNLNGRLQPIHRHEIEDHIDSILQEEGIGSIDGGGTLMGENGEISSCDIDIFCEKENITNVIEIIKNLPLPKGSSLSVDGYKEKIEIGNLEGLAFYFDNNLDEDVYKTYDINVAIDNFDEKLGNKVVLFSYAETKDFTVLYYYGKSFEEMKNLILEFSETYPLCENAKIEKIS